MKIVLYTQRVEIVKSFNERRDCADQRIPYFIRECGYLPVAIPNNSDIVREMVLELKPLGIILTGGTSLTKYGGDAPEKDIVDKILIDTAIENKIPLYGFCRGMESILDYFGNTLVKVDNHVSTRHIIDGMIESREVNSYHNLGCFTLDNNKLEVLMKSSDGVIEMIRCKDAPIVGTMWHPEREYPYREEDIKLVRNLMGGR